MRCLYGEPPTQLPASRKIRYCSEHYQVIEDADDVTYVVVCDPGDEAFDTLTQFARAQDLEASQITGVGIGIALIDLDRSESWPAGEARRPLATSSWVWIDVTATLTS